MKNSQKGSTAVILLVIIVVILLGVVGYLYLRPAQQQTQNITTSQNTNSQLNTTEQPVMGEQNSQVSSKIPSNNLSTNNSIQDSYLSPVISSIFPQKGSIGTIVSIVGKNLVDNRGEQNVAISNNRGMIGYLVQQNVVKNSDNSWTIGARIDSKICSNRLTDSGLCSSYFQLIPGNYSIYIDHNNVSGNHKSNAFAFVIQ